MKIHPLEPSNQPVVSLNMRKLIVVLFVLILQPVAGQTKILLLGNSKNICPQKSDTIQYFSVDSLPQQLNDYHALLIFSTARSNLTEVDQQKIIAYLESGKGVYLGCENWPLEAEANQLSIKLLGKGFWGNNEVDSTTLDDRDDAIFAKQESFTAGNSTVQYPLDIRLKVEVWSVDEPLIMSTRVFGGQLILDGGYSRFYCSEKGRSNMTWQLIVSYLLNKSSLAH